MLKKKSIIIVSFMGVDGSGKTTLTKQVKKKFKHSTYLHLKPYIVVKDLRRVIRNPHKETKSSFIISIIRIISWLVSYKIFFYKNTKKSKKIYLFDRYAHDILIDPLRYKHSLPIGLTKLMLSFFPKPDLWVFLKPSITTLKLRKQELSEQELKRQTKEYSFFFKNKKNVIKIDSKINRKTLTLKIKKRIDLISK